MSAGAGGCGGTVGAVRVAAVQMRCGPDRADNLERAAALVAGGRP